MSEPSGFFEIVEAVRSGQYEWVVALPYGWLAPLMFATALAVVFTGVPVAFALGGTAILFAVVGVAFGWFDLGVFRALPDRIFGILSNYVLLAIPFFVFMGSMFEKSKLAEGLLHTVGLLFGPLRGGLAFAVVFVGALLAASTGVVGASVVAMGVISLPVMLRYGYNPALTAGVIAASGTLGAIIPPSVVLVVLGDQMGVSVGDLFLGAMVPGLLLAAAYAVFIAVVAVVKPDAMPALPASERTEPLPALLRRAARVMIPPGVLVVVVLGSIFLGVATPTDAGALGALGAVGLAWANGRLNRQSLREVSDATTRLTTMVMFLLLGSTAFSLVFRGLDGDLWVADVLAALPGGRIGFLLFSNLVIFVLGFFIDLFEIAFIVVPLLLPTCRALGIDLVWFGVVLGMNLQTSFLTPPFGLSLFYLKAVAPPGLTTLRIYRGVVPFIVIQLIVLGLMLAFPELVSR
jgi:tripartite ATP-independent transporter DctM subunit